MANVREVLEFIVKGDAKGAIDAFRGVEHAAEGADKASGKFGGLFDKLTNRFPAAGRAAEKFGIDAGNAGAMAGTAATAAATAIGAFALKSVQAFQQTAGAILQFQRVSGTTAEEASRWVEVAGDYGVSSDQMGAAIGRLAKQAATAPEELARLGVQVAKNADGTVNLEETMLRAAEAFRVQTDDAKKAELGAKLFGKSWQDLTPLLVKGSDGIREALDGVSESKVFNDDDLKRAEEFRLVLDDLVGVSEDLMLQVGKGLVPVLSDLGEATMRVVEPMDKLTSKVGGLSTVIKLGPIGAFTNAMNGLGDIFEFVGLGAEEATEKAGTWNDELDRSRQRAGENARLNAVLAQTTAEVAAEDAAAADEARERDKIAKSLKETENERVKVQKDLAEKIRDTTAAGREAMSPELAYRASVRETAQALREAREKHQEYQKDLTNPEKAEAAQAAQDNLTKSLEEQAAQWVINRGKTLETEDGAQDYINKLGELKSTVDADFPDTARMLQEQIDKWTKIKQEIALATSQAAAYARFGVAPGGFTGTADRAAEALTPGGDLSRAAPPSNAAAGNVFVTVNTLKPTAEVGQLVLDSIKAAQRLNGF